MTRLKFKSSIPARLENALADFGFTFHSRKYGEWVMYEKIVEDEPAGNDEVPLIIQKQLARRLNKVVDSFLDPYSMLPEIRTQCLEMAVDLPEAERQWVVEWVTVNIDKEFCFTPWDNDDDQSNLGFC